MSIIHPVYDFSSEKNQKLIIERSISFEEIISAIQNGGLLDILEHPNQKKYGSQKIYVVRMNDYAYLVPFVMKDKRTVFLKTVFPSRKLTKQYLGHSHEK